MQLNFILDNKEFDDALNVSVNGELKELTVQERHISFDIKDNNAVTVQIEYKGNSISQNQTPFLRYLARLLYILLLSPIIFFADNSNGIEIHRFFYDSKPFNLKKTFILEPTSSTVAIRYVSPQYNKIEKCFCSPDIAIIGAEATDVIICCEYAEAYFKKSFRFYHYPAYTILFAVTISLTALMAICLSGQFSPFSLFGVIGMSFCSAVTLALLIAFIFLFISTHRAFREIDINLKRSPQTNDSSEKL